MATANSLPDFEAILQRGAVTEPRPLIRNRREDDNEISLNAAVEAAKMEKKAVSSRNKYHLGNEKSKGSGNRRMLSSKLEDSVFAQSPSSGPPRRHHTPSTLPRTKFTAATPAEQKRAIMELKQKLDFSSDGMGDLPPPVKTDRQGYILNNKDYAVPRDSMFESTASVSSVADSIGPAGSAMDSEISENIDIKKIMTRLTQVREYLQQATTMFVSLASSDAAEASKAAQVEKLSTLINQLRIQEQGYIDLLQRTLVVDNASEMTDVTTNESIMSTEPPKEDALEAQTSQLQQLQQQQELLKKIVEQQKQLTELKKRQSTLLAMQAQAERLVQGAESHTSSKTEGVATEQRANNQANPAREERSNLGRLASAIPDEELAKKQKLEQDLAALVNKKQDMEKLISVLKGLKEAQRDEAVMREVVGTQSRSNEGGSYSKDGSIMSDRKSSVVSDATSDFDDSKEKLRKLAEVRERLDELRSIVAEYEQNSSNDGLQSSSRDNRLVALHRPSGSSQFTQADFARGGARPKDPNRDIRIKNVTKEESKAFDDYDNRRQLRQAQTASANVNWNPGASKESRISIDRPSGGDLNNIDFSAVAKAADPDLLSKIGQLQEARERLVSFQTASAVAANNAYDKIYDLGKVQIKPQGKGNLSQDAPESDIASRSSRSNSMHDLDWQDDPELVEKIRKLQIAKEKLKKLQDLVSVIQQDNMPGLPVSDLLELSFDADGITSSKADSDDEESGIKKDTDADDASEARSDLSECQSQTSLAVEEGEVETDGDEVSESVLLNNRQSHGPSIYETEAAYQETRKLQREELDKLLKERQKLIEVQQQLSELTRKSLTVSQETQTVSPRVSPRATGTHSEDASPGKEKPPSLESGKNFSSLIPGQRTFRGTGARPKLLKRASNMSVEPQLGSRGGSEISYSPRHPRSVDTLPAAPLPNNPLVVSELRRQRDMFEQKKKQRFAEKHQMKQISDNNSEGGTFSIRSDIDEGVGVSMLSAEVTTATWGGSTEQSSTEEDSAVGEDEEREIGAAYEDGMAQAEEEEEEEDQSERGARRQRLFRGKSRAKKASRGSKVMTRWSDSDRPAGKKRKLNGKKSDLNRSGGSVSWAMNVSPSGGRSRLRQQNLTPAHRLMQDIRNDEDSNFSPLLSVWEQQCQHLHQQLASNTSLTGSLLRNQQTLLTMLQSQMAYSSDPTIGLSPTQMTGSQHSLDRYNRLAQAVSSCQNQLTTQQEELKSLRAQVSFNAPNASTESTGNRRPVDISKSTDTNWAGAASFSQIKSPGGTLYPQTFSGWQTPPRDEESQGKGRTSVIQSSRNLEDTHEVNTQTETSLFGEQFHTNCHDYSLFGDQQADEAVAKTSQNGQNFSPFRFYSPGEAIMPSMGSSETYAVGGEPLERITNASANNYNPSAYKGASAIHCASISTSNNGGEVLASSTASSPSKSLAMATLAGRQKSIWPSFLAQPSEQTGNVSDASSMYTSSFPGHRGSREGLNQLEKVSDENKADERADKASDATSNFSLFEALRDSIYNEVATLIAMNESRPHYLIELFRELQLLTSDYLRQRALYALQDLVTRYLTDENAVSDDAVAQQKFNYKQWTTSASEHTPSESLVTSDDEEQKALEALSSQIRNNDIYDYAEIAETGSTLSTPTSSADHPFARDQLGDTVINLDEALQKMKLYEESMAQTQRTLESMRLSDYRGSMFGPGSRERLRQAVDLISNSSAGDFNSETSSEVPNASVDTQKLDKQIKSVVMELVPFFNERTETTVTSEFLEEMKDLILTLARQREPHSEREEFGRFFHKQLESILHDSLTKFTGKKLNECGEDIITDVSEILFNELAFFKLMQDLDRAPRRNPAAAWAESNRDSAAVNGVESLNAPGVSATQNRQDLVIQDYETSETSSIAPDVELVHGLQDGSERTDESEENRGIPDNDVDQPDSARSEDSEDEAESSRQYVNLELSVSESRPVNGIGSGEEDVEEDQPTFSSGRANAARSPGSVNHESPNPDNDADESQTESQGEDTRPESDGAVDDTDPVHVDEEERGRYDQAGAVEEDERSETTRDMELGRQCSEEETAQVDGDVEGAVGGENVSTLNNNGSMDMDPDEGEVTIDDLPIKLTGLTEADLQARIASEQEQNETPAAVLSSFDGIDELAPTDLREPGYTPNGYPDH